MAEADRESAESGWSFVARWLLVLALVVLVPILVAALVGGALAWRYWQEQRAAAAEVRRESARIRASGQPLTAKDLYARHQDLGGAADATSAWLAAQRSFDPQRLYADAKGLPFVGDGDESLLRPGQVAGPLAEAAAFLQKYDAALQATLAAARDAGQCRLPIKFEDGASAAADSTQAMRTLVRLLALNLRVRACRGDAEGAVESLVAMIAASDAIAHQLTIVEQLVRMATLGMALEEAEFLLNEVKLTDEQLAALAARIAAADVQAGFSEGLLGERALGQETYEQHFNGVPFSSDRLKHLEIMSDAISASREPLPLARQHFQEISADFAAAQAAAGPLARQKHVLTAALIPALTASFEATARTLAFQRLLLAAIAVKRDQLRSGEFPAQLADLVPDYLSAVPADPFDGRPLRMLLRDGELILYSVGKDEMDDAASNPPGNSLEPDIVVRVRP